MAFFDSGEYGPWLKQNGVDDGGPEGDKSPKGECNQ